MQNCKHQLKVRNRWSKWTRVLPGSSRESLLRFLLNFFKSKSAKIQIFHLIGIKSGHVLTVALFYVTRYMVDSSPFRSGNRTKSSGKKSVDDFLIEFDKCYASTLCEANLNILIKKKDQFVGTKTLNSALRFVATAIKNAKMRKLCTPHIQTILFELTLPLMLISEQEYSLWNSEPIEYVRM